MPSTVALAAQKVGEPPVPSTALDPVEVVSVPFYGHQVPAALVHREQPLGRALYIPIRPLCERLGLSWAGQQQRIHRDPVLSRHARIVCLTHTNPAGGNPNMLCLPLDRVNGWLFGISTLRIKEEELRKAIIAYQEELYDVIYDYCAHRAGALVGQGKTVPDSLDLQALATDMQNVRVGVYGILDYLWQRHRHDEVVHHLLEMTRLDVHEVGGQVAEGEDLTERQRQTIYQYALELVALLGQLGELTVTRQNPFPQVFGGLKKRFKVATYRDIPRSKYRDAHAYLATWRASTQEAIRKAGEEPCVL